MKGKISCGMRKYEFLLYSYTTLTHRTHHDHQRRLR